MGNCRPWPSFYGWLALLLALPLAARAGEDAPRPSLWVDLCFGEPVPYEAVIEDLAKARVIYLGERHALQRHHDLQAKIVADLANKGVPLVLGLEQLEAFQQPLVDHFNRQKFDFEQLATATEWPKRWASYRQYRPVLEAARKGGAPVLALNAKSELIRQIARSGGVDRLPPEARKTLPAHMQLKDPLYEKLLGSVMMVHAAATPKRLRPMIEAQIARDETMAATLAAYLSSEQGRGRTAVVLCGAGHAAYGLGTVQRVRQRLPGVRDRIILFSESGDVQLSPQEKEATRPIEITHDQRREVNLPIGDYLHVIGLAREPPGAKGP